MVLTTPIVIWGAGAIGGTLGAAFLRAGHPVTFVDSVADHVAAINAHGLRIAGPIFEDVVKAPALLPKDVKGLHPLIFQLQVLSLQFSLAAARLRRGRR